MAYKIELSLVAINLSDFIFMDSINQEVPGAFKELYFNKIIFVKKQFIGASLFFNRMH